MADLLKEIDDFLNLTKMGPSYFGKASVGNSEVVKRLRNNKTITLKTAEGIRKFIRERRPDASGPSPS